EGPAPEAAWTGDSSSSLSQAPEALLQAEVQRIQLQRPLVGLQGLTALSARLEAPRRSGLDLRSCLRSGVSGRDPAAGLLEARDGEPGGDAAAHPPEVPRLGVDLRPAGG